MPLVRQFEQFWDSASSPPDVFAFLRQQGAADADQLLAVLLADQQRRWLTDKPMQVEDYLAGLSELPESVDWKQQLAIGEFQARRDTHRPLSIQEFSSRFPDFGDTLQERLPELKSGGPAQADANLDVPDLMQTEINVQSIASAVTYINSKTMGEQHKDRYRLDRILGEGMFGRVYLGFDDELMRQVAIKVPTQARFKKPEDADTYLAEARTVASLDHPHVVPVYDMGRTPDGSIYVVSKFIEGSTLEDRIKAGRPPERESAQLLVTVALALQHAHDRRLIHRDIKPANILLEDKSNAPYVADFGLAIREEDYLKHSSVAGTPAYMSPEQIRGEGHRLDGRSDIFSMGVILYELLTGSKPFRGRTRLETVQLVITQEPRPPREIFDTIPAELERICLKALSKRPSDRYATAAAFADDLQQWLKPATAVAQTKAAVQVVPRGLRSFDARDADFFLELLPGPVNRDGLPESIAFWKLRIEQTDPEQTFSVGLIYGPSGCGKSSLVKAGLLPHLSKDVVAVYVEATPEDTEIRVLRGLRKRLESVAGDGGRVTGPARREMGLADTLADLRRGQGPKVVIIIDQFEQWLHAHRSEDDAELVTALRHCDGGRLQAIVMVRDDFAMAASRFMRALDTRILEGHNFATVDLFNVSHAACVLTKFGQAFGRLPANAGRLSADEQAFVTEVAKGLAQDGKVVSVRLSLFAEMIRNKPWITATLDEVGGTQGIGVNFLEETFSSREANPDHRLHAVAARGILNALLPELGTNIKGHMRSHAELLEASGYASTVTEASRAVTASGHLQQPVQGLTAPGLPECSQFSDLLRILDGELRLITPTDPEGKDEGGRMKDETGESADSSFIPHPSSFGYYQLTHDYLVPSLREWLTRKQKETRRGRAELKLSERSALWNAKPENRYLPSLPEWLSIRTLSESKHWTASQRAMMNKAGRLHGIRSALVVVCVCALVAGGLGLKRQTDEHRNQAEATRLVEGLLTADTVQVSTSLTNLKEFRSWADPQLKRAFDYSATDSNAKLHAGLALIADGTTVDQPVLEFLQERLLTVTPGQFAAVRNLLEPHKSELTLAYWKLATDHRQSAPRRFRAACALAAFDPTNPSWNDSTFAAMLAEQLVSVNPVFVGDYQELVRPIAPQLIPALSDIFKDPARGELAKTLATSLLADYAAKDPDTLTDLVLAADAVSDKSLFPVLQQHQQAAVVRLESVLARTVKPSWADGPLDAAWTEPSPAVRARIESAHGLIAERFAFCQDMSLPQFLEIAETLRTSGYRPTRMRPYAGGAGRVAGDGKESHDAAADSRHAPLATRHPFVAAIWTRDSQRWELQSSLKQADLPGRDTPATRDNLLLTDIAPLPAADPTAETQFVALWCEASSANATTPAPDASGSRLEQRRVLLDVTDSELTAAQATLTQQGFTSQCTIGVRTDAGGQRRYTGIWSSQGSHSELRPAYAGFELAELPQWDVAVAPATRLTDPLETFRRQLGQIEKLKPEKLNDPQIREERATANYQLGNLAPALADLDFLIEKEIVTASVLQYRTLILARLGRGDEARECLEKYLATDAAASLKSYVQIQVPAWLGEFEQAAVQLESAVTVAAHNTNDLYNVMCAAALSSQALSAINTAQAQKFADRTIELLRQIVAQGYADAEQLRADADFASLHGDPRFLAIVARLEPAATFAAVWQANVEFESRLLTSVPLESVLDQLKPLLADGFRPIAIALDSTNTSLAPTPAAWMPRGGRDPAATEHNAQADGAEAERASPLCSLVLHRPNSPDAAKEQLALQQAAAATALLRLNVSEKVWPLFQDQPDPRLRSYVQHRLATYGIDPQPLLTQLQIESDVSRQRALIQGIGEFARANLLSPDQQSAAIADLAKRCAEDPDSGIHGAAEWALRQLSAQAVIAEVRAAYSTGTVVGDRRWYLTKTGEKSSALDKSRASAASSGMTFAIIQAEEEFLMGSPISETERYQGPTGQFEIRHHRRIGRRFAIGAYEVTMAQFQAFRSEHKFDRSKAREMDSPANMITWYDAAEYCNWLSREEGLPREQWCYDPDQPFAEGMTLVPDYLQRTGYRLPSEAEWEYACRAGTTTSRYFGETETLLGEYAWYTKTSEDKWMLPVGTLRPNGAGLFDMQGNVLEWCQDESFYYDTDREWMGDKEQAGDLSNSDLRVLRGGSFLGRASTVRSAHRSSYLPVDRLFSDGFRLARTLPPAVQTVGGISAGSKSGN